MICHTQGVDQKSVVLLQFDQQVVTLADDRHILGGHGCKHLHPVHISQIALFDDKIRTAIKAEQVTIRPTGPRHTVITEGTIERIGPRRAFERVIIA